MKKNIIIAVVVGALVGWHAGAMAQEVLPLKAKAQKSDTEENTRFEIEKNHALLSGIIKDAYQDLGGNEGELKEPIPLSNVTKEEVENQLNGQNYDYILLVNRAYGEADPVAIRGLSDQERKRRAELQARALNAALYQYEMKAFQDAWASLKTAHYLDVPELLEKDARIIAIMLCSDASMRMLQANNQEYIAMVRAINEQRSFADHIKHYIPDVWASERTLTGHTGYVASAAFSPDGSKIVTASNDETAKIWNVQTGALERTLAGHTGLVRSAAFSPDGSKIVTASNDETAKIWNVQTGALERALTGHTGWVRSAAFSPDGSKIVTASDDETAKIWNAQTGALERTFTGHTGYVASAAFSPDGSKIVTASDDGVAKIWNAQTGALERTLIVHTVDVYNAVFSYVGSAAFSPDGSKIVTTSAYGATKIWNAQTGALERTITDHLVHVFKAAFSPDGSKIVTATDDGTAKIWNVQTGALEWRLTGHTHWVHSAAFSPDGRKIATTSADKTAKIWAVLPAHTLEQALFLQYMQFIKNQSGHAGWESGWGSSVMDTYASDEKALIKNAFPQEQKTIMQKIGSWLGFGSSSSSSSSSNNNN